VHGATPDITDDPEPNRHEKIWPACQITVVESWDIFWCVQSLGLGAWLDFFLACDQLVCGVWTCNEYVQYSRQPEKQ